jgi:hypothetical protein
MGIYESLPFETLHARLLRLMEYMLEGVLSHIVLPRKVALWCEKRYSSNMRGNTSHRPAEHNFTESMVKTYQAEFERRIKIAMEIATRQSDRDIPKTSFNNGVTSLTRLSGQEYPGLVMPAMVILDKMLPSRKNHDVAIEKGYSRLLWLTLSLNVCLNNPRKTESEVLLLQKKNATYLQLYRSLIGLQRETRSPCGLRLVKFHCLTHFFLRVMHQDNGKMKFGKDHQEAREVCRRSHDALL